VSAERTIGAASSAAVTPDEIERGGANSGIEQRSIVDVMIAPPKSNECFLDNVLRVGLRTHPLPREKHQPRSKLRKAGFPIFMRGDIVHDLFTVFYIADAAKSRFCLIS